MTLLCVLSGCSPAPEPDLWAAPDGPGPYEVGVQTWGEFDDERDVPMVIEVWYPAEPGQDLERGGYSPLRIPGDALRDAQILHRSTPFGLVAFSHGYGGIRYQSAALCERIASHGFVVVSVDHPRNTMFDLDEDATPDVALNRPVDVTFALDAAAQRLGSDVVRDDVVGMVGHSFGALTSLMVGGGQVDLDGAIAHCEQTPTRACGFFELVSGMDASIAAPDPRVQAVAALAPGGWFIFGREGAGLSTVRRPLVLAGTKDADMPYDTEMRPTWAQLPSGSPLLTLEGAGHWAFSDLCAVITTLEDCAGTDGGFMDPGRVLELTQTAVVAHFQVNVLADERGEVWTQDAYWQQDDVLWERTP